MKSNRKQNKTNQIIIIIRKRKHVYINKKKNIYIYICLLYFAGTELNNQILRAVFINESTKID